MRFNAITFAFLFVMPSLAAADNVIKPGKVELYPTHSAVGIEAAYAYAAKSGDLRLRPGSPCIDRGVLLRGKAPDIGAFEFDK